MAGRDDDRQPDRTDRQLRFGWWALLFFLTLGIVLEAMHGFKVSWYLGAENETRRLLFTLAHAHGTLLAVINIVFSLTARVTGAMDRLVLASRCLFGATILLPGGFFLGGVVIYSGDPGLPVALVPAGALLLLIGVFLTARSTSRTG